MQALPTLRLYRFSAPALALAMLLTFASPTTIRAQTCGGDCSGDQSVTVDEILSLVTIALGSAPASLCPAGDISADGSITVDEILAAVTNALDGCQGGGPDPTATPTATVAAATATATETAVPTATSAPTAPPTPTTASGQLQGIDALQALVAGIVPAVSSFAEFGDTGGGASAADGVKRGFPLPPITTPCTGGGTVTFSCAPNGGGSQTDLEFASCRFVAPDGFESTIDGSFRQVSPVGCFGSTFPPGAQLTMNFDGSFSANDPTAGEMFSGTFDMEITLVVQADNTIILEQNGTGELDCLGTAVIETLEPLVLPPGVDCPASGRLRVLINGQASEILYNNGGVSLDFGADGAADQSFGSCEDPTLRRCNTFGS